MFFVMRDKSSQSKTNIWHEKCFQPFLTHTSVVKGPIIVYKWHNKNAANFHVSLNYHKSNLLGIKNYVENPIKKGQFIKRELKNCIDNTNIEKPALCCVIDNCQCTRIIASENVNKFLQESTVKERLEQQYDRFGGLRSLDREVYGDGEIGLQGIQRVAQNRRTGHLSNSAFGAVNSIPSFPMY